MITVIQTTLMENEWKNHPDKDLHFLRGNWIKVGGSLIFIGATIKIENVLYKTMGESIVFLMFNMLSILWGGGMQLIMSDDSPIFAATHNVNAIAWSFIWYN